jgi:hypothetical protein
MTREVGYTLIVLHGQGAEEDFKAISDRIGKRAPEITVVTGPFSSRGQLPDVVWARPTLIVALHTPFDLVPKRGLVYRCRRVLKSEQYQHYRSAGLKTPLTAKFTYGMELDPAEWSDHVVLKPMTVNSKGVGIHLLRTKRVGSLEPKDFPADHPIHKDQYLVQQFIDTGDYPCHFRVLSFFGEALYCRRNFSLIKRPSLDEEDADLMKGNVASNAGVKGTGSTEMADDREVLAFARRMHQAMPGIPLQGLDILRDVRNGELYALESNAGGNTWAFSSRLGENARRTLGGAEPMIRQFGAWDVAADVLIERTRAEAR